MVKPEASHSLRTGDDVLHMDYNQLIGVVRETNRPPGGLRSVLLLAQYAFLRPDSQVLEVGTSTGVSAIELARLIGCRVTAIDINEESLVEARRRAENAGVSHLVLFEQRDAIDTGFDAERFDLVMCGNVTSLIAHRDRALQEYTRVLKPYGILAAIPMYYLDWPSEQLLDDVSNAIGVRVEPLDREYWMSFFRSGPLSGYWTQDFRFDRRDDASVDAFVDQILDRPHLQELSPAIRKIVGERYREFMHLFKVNLSHMGFTVALFRKEPADAEPELFTARPVN